MARVRVPASIANVGTGFDVLAMAIDLWLEVEAWPADSPEWRFEGEGQDLLMGGSNPLSRLSMRGQVRNAIPVGVGLGSSAAARLAALALAEPGREDLFERAAAQEGHPDNAAAALFGGLVAAIGERVHHLPVPMLEVALLVAARPVPTEEARAALPAQVPRADAVHNSGRLALLVHAFHERRWELLSEALDDRLHQPYRLGLYPWTAAVMTAAREAGAYGAAISGAGPSVFAFCEPGLGQAVGAAMAAAAPGQGWPLVTRVSEEGLRLDR